MPHADQSRTPGRAVFLTGATGFLGAFILAELMERTEDTVHCLVRAADERQATERIHAALAEFRIRPGDWDSRIVAVPGDLSQPLLGIPEATFSGLAERLDVIYHAGAQVNFVYPYAALKAANVGGTQEIIRLAVRHHIKPVHHVSAVDALVKLGEVRVHEDDPLPAAPIPHGYVQSKWAAERAITTARAKGLPVSIYRPWLVGGHSATGVCHTTDYVLRLLHGSLEAGVVPDHDETLNISPVDFFSKALVHISLDDANLGKAYHLANPAGEPLTDLYDRIRSFGYRIEEVPYESWRERMHRAVPQTSPAYSVLPLIPEHPAGEAARHPAIDCTRAFAALDGTGITCPRLDERQVHQQLGYMVEVGFIPSPDQIESATLTTAGERGR